MQKIILRKEIEKYIQEMEEPVVSYINEGQIETFEAFETFDLVAFDWYDIDDTETDPSQMLIYIDTDDLFVICENEISYQAAEKYFSTAETNERALYLFFRNMFRGDSRHNEEVEERLAEIDDTVMHDCSESIRNEITDIRYEVLRLRKYYEQFDLIFRELSDNVNGVLAREELKFFEILENRCGRLSRQVMNLWEYVVQVRESYQAQIDIEQNRLMKVFTLVTSIFLPLTLIAGWYGMNLQMPEFSWKYAYPAVIGVCVVICFVWVMVFKRKGWFK